MKFTTKLFKIVTSKEYYLTMIALFLIELGLIAILGLMTPLFLALGTSGIALSLVALVLIKLLNKSRGEVAND